MASLQWLGDIGLPFLEGEGLLFFAFGVLLHKICILAGLLAAWYGADGLVRLCMAQPWFVWLSAFSFIIYASHAPMVAVLINPTLRALDNWPDPHLATYILLPLGLIALAVLLGVVLRNLLPTGYGWLTGGRGMLKA